MITWPQAFVSDLARRRTVLLLGSGVSMNSQNVAGRRPKTWVGILESMADEINPNRHIRKLIKERDLLTACEVIKHALGKERFNQLLREEYLAPQYLHARIHEVIFQLDSRIVATPNFDKIYETYANHAANGSIIVKQHYDPDIAEALRGTERVILKVHGTIDSPDRMIFTRKEYAEAREKSKSFYDLLGALALTHTFLFIGCGVNDPDIRLILEDLHFKHPSARPHIFVLPRDGLHQSVLETLEESMSVKILTYRAAEHHRELTDSLVELVALVELERDRLRNNGNW